VVIKLLTEASGPPQNRRSFATRASSLRAGWTT
jgi:hypothetical protein